MCLLGWNRAYLQSERRCFACFTSGSIHGKAPHVAPNTTTSDP